MRIRGAPRQFFPKFAENVQRQRESIHENVKAQEKATHNVTDLLGILLVLRNIVGKLRDDCREGVSRKPLHRYHAQHGLADYIHRIVSVGIAGGYRYDSMIERRNLHVFLALNTFWMLGRRSVGPPVGLSGSGTKCGFSDASHLCSSASAAVGRDVGLTVRQSLTKSRAAVETFAQYSAVREGSQLVLFIYLHVCVWRFGGLGY